MALFALCGLTLAGDPVGLGDPGQRERIYPAAIVVPTVGFLICLLGFTGVNAVQPSFRGTYPDRWPPGKGSIECRTLLYGDFTLERKPPSRIRGRQFLILLEVYREPSTVVRPKVDQPCIPSR